MKKQLLAPISLETIQAELEECMKNKPDLEPEVVEFLQAITEQDILKIESNADLPTEGKLMVPMMIYYINESQKFWLRHCESCVPWECKDDALKILTKFGITRENSNFSTGICLTHLEENYGDLFKEDCATSKSVKEVLDK